jgi:hypothetical protein
VPDGLAPERAALLDGDGVDTGPGEPQAGDARGGVRPQPDPCDQPRRHVGIIDARRSIADAGAQLTQHVVGWRAHVVASRQQQAHHAGTGQAGAAVADHLERQIVFAVAVRRARFPHVRHARADAHVLGQRRDRQRRRDADVEHAPPVGGTAAELGPRRLHLRRIALAGKQREPQAVVEAGGRDIDAGRLGLAVGEHRRGHVALRRAGHAVEIAQIGQQLT